MPYYNRNRGWMQYGHQQERKRFSGEQIVTDMERISQMENLTPWERNFINSISEGYKKYNSLTEGQHGTLQKISARYNPENLRQRAAWRESFSDDMREKMQIMARYYKSNPPYYGDLATRVLEDSEYIPSEKAYRSMCENKYAQRVINTALSEPEYPAGTMVMVRNSRSIAGTVAKLKGQIVVVLDHPETVQNAARGARPVRVLPIGGTDSVLTEERWLKKLPKKLA
jgi:hypothetical protein